MKRADRLFEPVDNASLVFLRVTFGAVMLWQVCKYLPNDWIGKIYVQPEFHFTYPGFEWLSPWPGVGMYLHFAALGLAALGVLVGFRARLCALVFGLGYGYVFLLEKANYQNHLYLLTLLAFVLAAAPCGGRFSLDALLRPKERSTTAPRWALSLARFQIALPYFFGGLAKINSHWLRGQPVKTLLADHADLPVLGPLMTLRGTQIFFAYGGLLFDLLVVPALLNPRTRRPAFAAAVFFHLTNAFLFEIGVFPWLMLAATTIFFPPDWPVKLLGPFGLSLSKPGHVRPSTSSGRTDRRRTAVLAGLGVWAAVQLALPLRHWLYPGDVKWTMEGDRFAWRMMLHSRRTAIAFMLTDPETRRTVPVDPAQVLGARQSLEMSYDPDMILEFAHYLAEALTPPGRPRLEVRARTRIQLDDSEPTLLVDPSVDLASVPREGLRGILFQR